MATPPKVPLAQARAHVLVKQGLAGDGLGGVLDALVATAGIYGTAPTCYLSWVRGSWRSDNYAYARWADWLGAPLERVEPEAGRVQLARRYLRALGPASGNDLRWWTGWTKRDTTAALAALGDELAPVSLDGVAAGVWELDPDAVTVTVAPFGKPLASRWDELDAQVDRLSAAIGTELRLRRAAPPGPLADGARNAYLSPISLGGR